jgi:hypothetical protein
LGKSNSKRGVTLQFLCTLVALVAFIGMVEQVRGNTLRRYFVMMKLENDAAGAKERMGCMGLVGSFPDTF